MRTKCPVYELGKLNYSTLTNNCIQTINEKKHLNKKYRQITREIKNINK